MGIRESLLNTITSVGNSDFVRIVTSAGASSKATVANLFKSFESGLGAKSSLTNSDYLRVVGSDNNAYKQSLSDVRTALGIGASASYSSLEQFYAEFASMEVNTKYFVNVSNTCAAALGLPSGTYKGYVSKSTSTICDMTVQWYGASGDLNEYIGRVTFDNNGSVTATHWTAQPTRTEVDALNSKTSTFITADNYRSVLATFGTQTVTPVFVDTSLVSVIFGISGANGTGLCIRHNLNTYDFVFFDSRIRLVRYNSSTDTFSRKHYIDMIAMQ